MAWSSVQDDLPSASTSGGQSSGSVAGGEAAAGFEESADDFWAAMADHAAKDVHERHLCTVSIC